METDGILLRREISNVVLHTNRFKKGRVKIKEGDWNTVKSPQLIMDSIVSLKDLTEEILNKFNIEISKETIRRYLDNSFFTFKYVSFEPESVNSEETKEYRIDFVEKFAWLLIQ